MSADELRATFLRQAEALKSSAPVGVDVPAGAWLQHAADYINKACHLADKLPSPLKLRHVGMEPGLPQRNVSA